MEVIHLPVQRGAARRGLGEPKETCTMGMYSVIAALDHGRRVRLRSDALGLVDEVALWGPGEAPWVFSLGQEGHIFEESGSCPIQNVLTLANRSSRSGGTGCERCRHRSSGRRVGERSPETGRE